MVPAWGWAAAGSSGRCQRVVSGTVSMSKTRYSIRLRATDATVTAAPDGGRAGLPRRVGGDTPRRDGLDSGLVAGRNSGIKHVMLRLRSSAIALGMSAALVIPVLGAGPAVHAGAEDDICRVMEIDLTPTTDLQMVMWLEDTAGNYIATTFITRLTGRFGLGNRPGIMEFNTAWRWPYGRRTTT